MGRPKKIQEEKVEKKEEGLSKFERAKLAMQESNKQNPGIIKFAVDEPTKESIGFGHKELDEFTGGGGVYGNFVVYWGDSGVGKTTMALMQIAEAQKQGKVCMYIDMEHSLTKERMKLFGVNLDQLLLVENCETAEDAMNLVIRYTKEKLVDVIVVDSIQALSTKEENISGKSEKTKDMEDKEIASLAKVMGKFLRRTAPHVYKGQTAVIMIGQARTGGIGTFITKDDLTGGRAIKFWAILLMYLRKGQGVDAAKKKVIIDGEKKEIKIGFDCVMRIDKTKKFNSKCEGSELHLQYFYESGFNKPQEDK